MKRAINWAAKEIIKSSCHVMIGEDGKVILVEKQAAKVPPTKRDNLKTQDFFLMRPLS